MKSSLTQKNKDTSITQNAFNQKKMQGYPYQTTDIRLIQREVMKPYVDNFIIHQPIGDSEAVASTLTGLLDSLDEVKPTLCVYNLGDWHWIVFAAIKAAGKIYVLYKDSKGRTNEKLEQHIKKISERAEFIANTVNEQPSGVECGIFAVKNMEIMAVQLSADREEFIDGFKDFEEFCSLETAKDLRKGEFPRKYVLGKCQEMAEEAIKLNKLQKLRERHSSETNTIKSKLEKEKFFKDLTIKALAANDQPGKEDSIIAIEIAITPDTSSESIEYAYTYRISLSSNLSKRAEEIFDNISKALEAVPSSRGDRVAIFPEENLTTIAKIPKAPIIVIGAEKPSITISELFKNLSVYHNPFAQKEVGEIIIEIKDITIVVDSQENKADKPQNDSASSSIISGDSDVARTLKSRLEEAGCSNKNIEIFYINVSKEQGSKKSELSLRKFLKAQKEKYEEERREGEKNIFILYDRGDTGLIGIVLNIHAKIINENYRYVVIAKYYYSNDHSEVAIFDGWTDISPVYPGGNNTVMYRREEPLYQDDSSANSTALTIENLVAATIVGRPCLFNPNIDPVVIQQYHTSLMAQSLSNISQFILSRKKQIPKKQILDFLKIALGINPSEKVLVDIELNEREGNLTVLGRPNVIGSATKQMRHVTPYGFVEQLIKTKVQDANSAKDLLSSIKSILDIFLYHDKGIYLTEREYSDLGGKLYTT